VSIRRECLDHVIVFNEKHLRRILTDCLNNYHRHRTHRSLKQDCPQPRAVERPDQGKIILNAFPNPSSKVAMTELHKALLAVSTIASFASFTGALPARAAFGDRITIVGTEFRAGADRIWINGANTPWHTWNEFGGDYDRAWWDKHFQQLHDSGVNATRVWISCSGDASINIDSNGHVSGCTPAFWKDVDSLFEIARKRQVYIMATLISYDHFQNNHTNYLGWRKMITSSTNIDSIVDNYVVPFVTRYKDNPWLWCIDLCNEPDWIYENAKCGKISWDHVQTFFAKASAAIHANSTTLVTVGWAMGPKYNSSLRTNIVSDSALRAAAGGDPRAHLDFCAAHHYDWEDSIYGNPFYMSPTAYGMEPTKPAVIGECPAKGTKGHTIVQDYENACRNGWQGAMSWSSSGVDSNGDLKTFAPATRAFRDNHPALVFPGESLPAKDK
jgi:hypothetical protein